jgi:hypothetical protein
MPQPKMTKTKTPMPQAGRDKPLPDTNFDASFSRYNPGYQSDPSKRLKANSVINPSYPELVVMSGISAVRGARTAATLKEPAKFSMKKAAIAFGADLGVDAALDYDRERRKK